MIKNRTLFFIVLIATFVFVGIYIFFNANDQQLNKTFIISSILSIIGGVVFFLLSKGEKGEKFVRSIIVALTPIVVYALLAVIGAVIAMGYLLKGIIKVYFFGNGYHG